MKLKRLIPTLKVSNAAASRAFYEKLGFKLDFIGFGAAGGGDPVYLGVKRDGLRLHLSSHAGDGVAGALINFEVKDVDRLHAAFVKAGVPIHMPPTDQTWGLREMAVKDPDGNRLTFRQDIG